MTESAQHKKEPWFIAITLFSTLFCNWHCKRKTSKGSSPPFSPEMLILGFCRLQYSNRSRGWGPLSCNSFQTASWSLLRGFLSLSEGGGCFHKGHLNNFISPNKEQLCRSDPYYTYPNIGVLCLVGNIPAVGWLISICPWMWYWVHARQMWPRPVLAIFCLDWWYGRIRSHKLQENPFGFSQQLPPNRPPPLQLVG